MIFRVKISAYWGCNWLFMRKIYGNSVDTTKFFISLYDYTIMK